MGKLAKVMRCATTEAEGGNSGCTRASSAFTYCSVWNMSTFQLKNRSISAEPRLVIERTSSRPGTVFTASSSGRVMVTIIWSMGITPLSTAIRILGKFVVGNTDTGMVNARYIPTSASVMMTKMTGLECRANQYEDSVRFTLVLLAATGDYFFSSLSPLSFLSGAGLEPFLPASPASAVSTLILVLSGSP